MCVNVNKTCGLKLFNISKCGQDLMLRFQTKKSQSNCWSGLCKGWENVKREFIMESGKRLSSEFLDRPMAAQLWKAAGQCFK